MTAVIISGKYFGANEQVTNTKLHQIVESAQFSNIGTGELASDASVVQISATAPTDTTRPWYDTTIGILRLYDGSVWTAPNCLVMTNAGSTVNAGDIVVVDTGADNSFNTTTSANNTRVIGVARETIANSASGLIQTSGMVSVNLSTSSHLAGEFFISTSTTAGKALLSATAAAGKCGHALINPLAAGSTALCLLWGQPAS